MKSVLHPWLILPWPSNLVHITLAYTFSLIFVRLISLANTIFKFMWMPILVVTIDDAKSTIGIIGFSLVVILSHGIRV